MGEFSSLEAALEIQNLVIEKPRASDLFALTTFSNNLGFTESMWKSLAHAGTVVCARTRTGRIDGLYVANHYSLHSEEHEMRGLRAAQNVLCNRFHLAPDNVAFGAQAIISDAWPGSNLRRHLLRELLRTVGLRYRHLYCCCRKNESAEMQVLADEGWRCFEEEDETCYFVLDAAKALRGLASQLALRMPLRSPASTDRLHV